MHDTIAGISWDITLKVLATLGASAWIVYLTGFDLDMRSRSLHFEFVLKELSRNITICEDLTEAAGLLAPFEDAPAGVQNSVGRFEGDSANPKLGKPSVFQSTPFMELLPIFSNDGRWLAYLSNESSILEVHVRAFPGPGGRWELPVSGGTMPVWSRDGRELLFESADHRVMAVSYTAKIDSFAFGKPRVWSEARMMTPGTLGTVTTWDLAPDGKRLAALQPLESEKTRTSIAFLLNFNDELQRMTAAGK